MKSVQLASKVLMIRPTAFGFNEEAYKTNAFQNPPERALEVNALAAAEFDSFVEKLEASGVEVLVISDVSDSKTPDSVFPNNWFSTHEDGRMLLYPMAISNRRAERRLDVIGQLMKTGHYAVEDWSAYEANESPMFVEGTGSLIFDHDSKVVYAALSPRTDAMLVDRIAKSLNYLPVKFHALGKAGELIYHTNVMMSIGDRFVTIGLDTVSKEDRPAVLNALSNSGKEIIELSNEQVYEHFTGNMLQLNNDQGETVLALSSKAYKNLNSDQLNKLDQYVDHYVQAEIPTIESVGGGSARCMLAELY